MNLLCEPGITSVAGTSGSALFAVLRYSRDLILTRRSPNLDASLFCFYHHRLAWHHLATIKMNQILVLHRLLLAEAILSKCVGTNFT